MSHYTEDSWNRPLIIYHDGQPVGQICFEKGNEEMKVVCSWCGNHMKGNEEACLTSHGICHDCMIKESGGGSAG